MHVHQPNSFLDQIQLGKSLDIESSLTIFTVSDTLTPFQRNIITFLNFQDVTAVKKFMQMYRIGLLPRNEVFSILNEIHRHQAIQLFRVLYTAKDYETFYKVACWARTNINEGMFVYALNVAILHRPDCKGLILPPMYEIYPYYFINHEVIRKAQQYKLQNYALLRPDVIQSLVNSVGIKPIQRSNVLGSLVMDSAGVRPMVGGVLPSRYQRLMMGISQPLIPTVNTPYLEQIDGINVMIIPSNYSGWYLNVDREQSLSYFTEDVGLNSWYYYFHAQYPSWMSGVEYGLNKERRGELYLYTYQQLLARYYLERLSVGLGKIDLIDINRPIDYSYVCTLQYENGLPFPIRPKYTQLIFNDRTLTEAELIQILEKRILEAIDLGFVVTEEGQKIPLYTSNGINMLGNLIQGNADSINIRFYRYISLIAKILLGYSGKPVNAYQLIPSVLEHYETALRDPMFYTIYKRIVNLLLVYKSNLPSYTYHDLLYPGVKIESLVIDKLITYFDYFDIDLVNAINTDFTQQSEVPSIQIKARQMRLNHKPFNYKINILSDKLTKSVIRIFLGPKYDEMGRLITINENRNNFVELDKFIYELKVGQNVIVRNSRQAYHTIVDRTTLYDLYRKVMIGNIEKPLVLESVTGFPNRLLLPKGTRSGMEFQMFVMVSPYTGVEAPSMDCKDCKCGDCGCGLGAIDGLPMGYPLDRKIDLTQFMVPNMLIQDVTILHKRYEEVMLTKNVVVDY